MWEDATPKPVPDAGDAAETGRPAGGRPAREKAGENYEQKPRPSVRTEGRAFGYIGDQRYFLRST